MTNEITTTKMATARQCWALKCITQKDYRNDGLTYDQASNLIKELGDPNYVKKSKSANVTVTTDNVAKEIHNRAYQAGMDALNTCVPTPMVVLGGNKEYFVEGGVCGFSWISFKATTSANRKFLAGLKKAGLAGGENDHTAPWRKDTYRGGFQFWVSEDGQSMTRKEAFAHAFNAVLAENGITAYAGSRMD